MKKREVAARRKRSPQVLFVALICIQDIKLSFPFSLSSSSSLAQSTIQATVIVTGKLTFIVCEVFDLAPNSTPFTPFFVFTWLVPVSAAQVPRRFRTSPVLSTHNNPFPYRRLGRSSRFGSGLFMRLRFMFLFISPSLEAQRLPGSLFGQKL